MTSETPGDDVRPPGAEAPSDEAHELVKRLRAAPAAELISDLFSTLLSTAQVKLGRRDARLFIDLSALMLEYTGPHLPDELGQQVDSALGQLRLAQVGAEKDVARRGEPEPSDLDRIPTPPSPHHQGESGSTSSVASPASRLWVPGQ